MRTASIFIYFQTGRFSFFQSPRHFGPPGWWLLEEYDRSSGVCIDDEQVPLVGQFTKLMDVSNLARRQAHSFEMGGPEAATLVDDLVGALSRGVSNERRTLTNVALQLCRDMARLAREAASSAG